MPYRNYPTVTSQKPVNIFYVWYAELCRRLNSAPAASVKPAKPKCQTVLSFVADRLKVEEWNPVISALRHDTSLHVIAIKSKLGATCQFLHDVDTEEKVRQMKRRSGSLWTAFVLKSLLKSLSCTVRNTQVLTCLEFDGLPMFAQYLEPLMKALQKNKTLRNLSLSRCKVGDDGCRMICAYLRFAPNIEWVNLSCCGLTVESGEHIGKLIKYQQINRYCESWHNSLRYSDPNVHVMRGIKRITLNCNPLLGDKGLDHILGELDDDLWIRALDMQKCGVTESMAMRIVDLVEYSQSLEIADFRLNPELSEETVEKILNILKGKHFSNQSEYQWCSTSYALTTCESSMIYSVTNYGTTGNCTASVYKVKSAPIKQGEAGEKPLRRTKTMGTINTKNKKKEEEEEIKKKLSELSSLLQEEISKRQETEKVNLVLRRKLSECASKDVLGNGVKKKNGVKNGYHGQACNIFEKLVSSAEAASGSESLGEESLLEYVKELNGDEDGKLMNGYDMTDSQISLFKFMENLKNNKSSSEKYVNNQNNTNYYINNKHVKKKM